MAHKPSNSLGLRQACSDGIFCGVLNEHQTITPKDFGARRAPYGESDIASLTWYESGFPLAWIACKLSGTPKNSTPNRKLLY